jgi:hypothetical protein
MRYHVTTPLTPREALEQALADFGPDGLGLHLTSQTNLSLVLQGGGGHIAVTAEPSALSILDFRVEGLEFSACVIDFELPIDPALLLVTGRRPRGGFRRQLLGVAKPAVV